MRRRAQLKWSPQLPRMSQGSRFSQFSIRTLLTIIALVAVVCALARAFGLSTLYALGATTVLFSIVFILKYAEHRRAFGGRQSVIGFLRTFAFVLLLALLFLWLVKLATVDSFRRSALHVRSRSVVARSREPNALIAERKLTRR